MSQGAAQAKGAWGVRAGAIGGGSAQRFRWRSLFRMRSGGCSRAAQGVRVNTPGEACLLAGAAGGYQGARSRGAGAKMPFGIPIRRCCLQIQQDPGHPGRRGFRVATPQSTRSHTSASSTLLPRSMQDLLSARTGSPLAGRVLHPLDDKQRFMKASHPLLDHSLKQCLGWSIVWRK